MPGLFSATETVDVGMDLGAPVSHAYHHKTPFAFTGEIEHVTIQLK